MIAGAPAWLQAVAAACTVLAAFGLAWERFIGPFIARPISDAARSAVEGMIDGKLEAALQPVYDELSANGGTSTKDLVQSTHTQLTRLAAESRADRRELWQTLVELGADRRRIVHHDDDG